MRETDPATSESEIEWEYIVVGSGAGGGTVAARLAEEGCKVILLEAGGDPALLSGSNAVSPNANTLPADFEVPAFSGSASENTAMKWDFFVRHYSEEADQQLDPNYLPKLGGVLYPRAGTLGGCTAHNAMILVYPQNEDWDHIAELTDDLKQYIRSNCWGHHASCTCAIGPIEQNGVLDSSFRVHKTQGLRVVDASAFPRIPGFFIACATYMLGERAAGVILAERANSTRPSNPFPKE